MDPNDNATNVTSSIDIYTSNENNYNLRNQILWTPMVAKNVISSRMVGVEKGFMLNGEMIKKNMSTSLKLPYLQMVSPPIITALYSSSSSLISHSTRRKSKILPAQYIGNLPEQYHNAMNSSTSATNSTMYDL